MDYRLKNPELTVCIARRGAELQSISATDGTEFLWQGSPDYWEDRAPTLFPYIARLTGGEYELDGKRYAMPIHGFAPKAVFSLVDPRPDSIALRLTSSRETLAMYPYRFCFDVLYALHGRTLSITYRVENVDNQTMYFGVGGHPGFRVPMEPGQRFEDCFLEFSLGCQPRRIDVSPDCFILETETPFPLEESRFLPLHHRLFDNDAIILKDTSGQVTLRSRGSRYSLRVSYMQMPYLGLWHMPKTDAPYLCIEPWSSLPSRKGVVENLKTQPGLVALEAGQIYENTWSIAILSEDSTEMRGSK